MMSFKYCPKGVVPHWDGKEVRRHRGWVPKLAPGKLVAVFQLGMGGDCSCPELSSKLLPPPMGNCSVMAPCCAQSAMSSGPGAPSIPPHHPSCLQRKGRAPWSQTELGEGAKKGAG